MERTIEQVIKKKVRIIKRVAKKDPGVSINNVLEVMKKGEKVHFMRNEWNRDSIVSTVARANTLARVTKEIQEHEFKYQSSDKEENDFVIVTRNL